MRKILVLALGLLALSWPADAQDAVNRFTLMSAFDLDGEGLDVDQIIVATALVDNGTSVAGANWAIVAQPDVCRLVDLTISDTNMSAGTITVVGTGCFGEAKSCSWSAWTGGDDDGVKTLTCTDSRGAYLASVTTVTTGVMTGESDETFALGYSTAASNGWAMFGTLLPTGPSGELGVNPLGSFQVQKLITTTNACSNTVTGVSGAADAFETVSAGDLLLFTVRDAYGSSRAYQRKVTARASADSITIGGACVIIPTAGVNFSYKKFYFSTNPADAMLVPVGGWSAADFTWSVDSNTNTGGVVTSLQCSSGDGPEWISGRWVEVDTATVASTATQADTVEAIDLSLADFKYCRFGVKFGTGDDDDTGIEDINVEVTLRK